MKNIRSYMLIFVLLLSLVVTVGAAPDKHHQLVRTPFTGVDTFAGMLDPGNQYVKNGRFIIEGMVEQTNDILSDPRLCGLETVTINANLAAATGIGPMWGTSHIVTAGGTWDTLWVGQLTGAGHAVIYLWGWGRDGYAGMTVFMNLVRQAPYTPVSDWAVSGYILERN
jgi:hypothetical protein